MKVPFGTNPQVSKVLSLTSGVGQNIVIHISHTSRNISLFNFYLSSPFDVFFFFFFGGGLNSTFFTRKGATADAEVIIDFTLLSTVWVRIKYGLSWFASARDFTYSFLRSQYIQLHCFPKTPLHFLLALGVVNAVSCESPRQKILGHPARRQKATDGKICIFSTVSHRRSFRTHTKTTCSDTGVLN